MGKHQSVPSSICQDIAKSKNYDLLRGDMNFFSCVLMSSGMMHALHRSEVAVAHNSGRTRCHLEVKYKGKEIEGQQAARVST